MLSVTKCSVRNTLLTSCLLALSVLAVHDANAVPSIVPTGVTVHDTQKTYNSDVLFSAADHKTYLIDINGHVLKRWDVEGFPARLMDPALVDGRKGVIGAQLKSIELNDAAGTGLVPGMPTVFRDKTIGLVDWHGKTVWEWGNQAPGGAARQHHDWQRLANGNMLVLANLSHPIEGFGTRAMLDDVIYEVTPEGKIVWKWVASEHLDEFGFTDEQLAKIRSSAPVDFLHTNDMQILGPNQWAKSGDGRFAPDNIIISSRDYNFTAIISKETGKVVWRLGPNYPAREEFHAAPVPRPVDQISGQHDAHMIPEGLPGAGNILLFDNQGEAGIPPVALQVTGGSRILEISPVSKQIVWEYTGASSGKANWSFYSPFISSVQRLPNGNTLIDEGINGRFFQVTPQGEIVWEYVSPFQGEAPLPPVPGRPQPISNWVYRIQGVPVDWVPYDSAKSATTQHKK